MDDLFILQGRSKGLTDEQAAKLATLGQRYIKTADPTVNDDSAAGYAIWDKWLNQTAGEAYVCTAATEGAAVWQNISLDTEDLASLFDAKISHDLATAENDFLVGAPTPFGTFVKKTLAQTKIILAWVLSSTSEAVGFTISGGTASKTLTVDETKSLSDKADKDTDAVTGNIAQFDANGNPVDSGIPSLVISEKINFSGNPKDPGFPNGICPPELLPPGMVGLPGYTYRMGPNFGNYQYEDGSIMVYRPQTFIKIGDGTNGLAVNVVDVKPYGSYEDEASANADGYFIHDIFKNGGVLKKGIFRDKYHNSKNVKGTGFVASSIKNGPPISTHADHNPIADLTACSANAYHEAINAAHARDGVDGAVNSSSIFFVEPRQLASYIALTTTAHAQASTSDTYCAWYDATGVTNYPKGCNDNALGDTDDATVEYVSDGYSNCGKAGSGAPFAKTTDNGQECGIADVNGLMWRINIGMTCIATTSAIEGITRANPAQVTITGSDVTTGTQAMLTGIGTGDWAGLDDRVYTLTRVDADNFTLDGVDTSAFTDAYAVGTNAGSLTFGTFYKKTDAASYEDFTSGNSLATDHWGATGVAAMMEEVDPEFVSGGAFAQRFGNSTNQVLGTGVSGNDFEILQVGLPISGGVSSGGTNLFGSDYFYQYIRNELCVIAGGNWYYGSSAGVFYVNLSNSRTNSTNSVGFACACYPV